MGCIIIANILEILYKTWYTLLRRYFVVKGGFLKAFLKLKSLVTRFFVTFDERWPLGESKNSRLFFCCHFKMAGWEIVPFAEISENKCLKTLNFLVLQNCSRRLYTDVQTISVFRYARGILNTQLPWLTRRLDKREQVVIFQHNR